MTTNSLSHFSVKTQDSEKRNAAWQAIIKSDALRRRQQSIAEDSFLSSDSTCNGVISSVTTNAITDSPTAIYDAIRNVTTVASPILSRRDVCEKFTLNDEQARAFSIVCRHADGESHLKIGIIISDGFFLY